MSYTASRRLCLAALVVLWGAVGVQAQEASPDNYDFVITTDKATYAPEEQVVVTVAVATRAGGVQAWSFGVANGPELALVTATAEGSDAGGLTPDFLAVAAVEGGFFGSAILSTTEAVVTLPDAATTSLAIATYDVAATACDGQDGDITSSLSFLERPGHTDRRYGRRRGRRLRHPDSADRGRRHDRLHDAGHGPLALL